jgi:exopolyphosphatase/guanosine-5'-triphosphate,3'-diphosphate pyrophosphatase
LPIFGAVDIGANSVRLKISKLVRRRLKVVHEDREVTRLGEAVFASRLLDPAAMEHTIKVLKRFHRLTQQFGVDHLRIVATSALRDADNGTAFTEWVRSATGWHLEVVSGLEEGRLIHLGVQANTRIRNSRALLIDLGGGSCELTLSTKGQIEDIYSLPLGAVRLTRDFMQHDPPRKNELHQLRAYIEKEVIRVEDALTSHRVDLVIATSGTPAALADMWSAEQGVRTSTVPSAELQRLARRLSRMSVAERRAIKGIGPRRAEIIVAGAMVFSEIFSRLKLPGFRYVPYGLRDGLLFQMAAEYTENPSLQKALVAEREHSIVGLAGHYQADLTFARRVRELALQLFRSLGAVHNLPQEYEGLLTAAAMLHEIGSFLNRAGRHRHTHYILAHSELLGFTTRQRIIIAAITRFIGKSRPAPETRALRALPELDRLLVPRAVLLLRLARALEQGRRGAVTGLRTRVAAERVMLRLQTRSSGAELELWALDKERDYFREVFGRELDCAAL